jgi:hypothetical protein
VLEAAEEHRPSKCQPPRDVPQHADNAISNLNLLRVAWRRRRCRVSRPPDARLVSKAGKQTF